MIKTALVFLSAFHLSCVGHKDVRPKDKRGNFTAYADRDDKGKRIWALSMKLQAKSIQAKYQYVGTFVGNYAIVDDHIIDKNEKK